MSKEEKSGLRRSKGHLRRGEVLRRSEGNLAAAQPKGQMAPKGSLQRSCAMPQRQRHYSQRQKISDFVPKASYLCIDSIRTLINY